MMPTSIPVDFKALDDKCDQKKRRFLIGSMNEEKSMDIVFMDQSLKKLERLLNILIKKR